MNNIFSTDASTHSRTKRHATALSLTDERERDAQSQSSYSSESSCRPRLSTSTSMSSIGSTVPQLRPLPLSPHGYSDILGYVDGTENGNGGWNDRLALLQTAAAQQNTPESNKYSVNSASTLRKSNSVPSTTSDRLSVSAFEIGSQTSTIVFDTHASLIPTAIDSSSFSPSSSSSSSSLSLQLASTRVAAYVAFIHQQSQSFVLRLPKDLLLIIYSFLPLSGVRDLVICCRGLSITHFNFKWPLYHSVDFVLWQRSHFALPYYYERYRHSQSSASTGFASTSGQSSLSRSFSTASKCVISGDSALRLVGDDSHELTSDMTSPNDTRSFFGAELLALRIRAFYNVDCVLELQRWCPFAESLVMSKSGLIASHSWLPSDIPSTVRQLKLSINLGKSDMIADIFPAQLASLSLLGFDNPIDSSLRNGMLPTCGVSGTQLTELHLSDFYYEDAGVSAVSKWSLCWKELQCLQFHQSRRSNDLLFHALNAIIAQRPPLQQLRLPFRSDVDATLHQPHNARLLSECLQTLSNTLTELELSGFNEPITVRQSLFPAALRFLQLDDFNNSLEPGALPMYLETLELLDFNQPLAPGALPLHLSALELSNFNQPLQPGALPSSLRTLRFRRVSHFNQPILPGLLPSSLRCLLFDNDQPFDLSDEEIPQITSSLRFLPQSLPQSLQRLSLPFHFNQSLHGILPPSLHELQLGLCFNHSLKPGTLPHNLQVLRFSPCSEFALAIEDGELPDSLTVLDLQCAEHLLRLPSRLPSFLRVVTLPACAQLDRHSILPPLPSTLHTLELAFDFTRPWAIPDDWFSAALQKLKFNLNGREEDVQRLSSGKLKLPPSLIELEVLSHIKVSGALFSALPLNDLLCLEVLNINESDFMPFNLNHNFSYYSHFIPLDISNCPLRELVLPDGFTQLIAAGALPNSLRYLSLGGCWNHPLHDESGRSILPANLLILHCSRRFCQAILPNDLPDSLRVLWLGRKFRIHSEQDLCLPPHLRELSFDLDGEFCGPLTAAMLPPTLAVLNLSVDFKSPLVIPQASSLQELNFHINYSVPLPSNSLPNSLLYLKLGTQFCRGSREYYRDSRCYDSLKHAFQGGKPPQSLHIFYYPEPDEM